MAILNPGFQPLIPKFNILRELTFLRVGMSKTIYFVTVISIAIKF